MTKINKSNKIRIDETDLENISFLKKELKLKSINSIRIKKGDYEIEIASISNFNTTNNNNSTQEIEKKSSKVDLIEINKKNINSVKSPMVGVAYLSADPSTPPYVKIGQHVKQGDTLLLIEAMKTFNEVKAPITGIVKDIPIFNSQPVEFGDELIIFE